MSIPPPDVVLHSDFPGLPANGFSSSATKVACRSILPDKLLEYLYVVHPKVFWMFTLVDILVASVEQEYMQSSYLPTPLEVPSGPFKCSKYGPGWSVVPAGIVTSCDIFPLV